MSNIACNGPCGPFLDRADGFKECAKCGEVYSGIDWEDTRQAVLRIVNKVVAKVRNGKHTDAATMEEKIAAAIVAELRDCNIPMP